MLKDGKQSFQQTFHVFSIIKLEKTAVTVRETEYKIFCFIMEFSIFVEICCTEVCLCFTKSVFKGNVTNCSVKIKFLFSLFDIKGNQPVAAGKTIRFVF